MALAVEPAQSQAAPANSRKQLSRRRKPQRRADQRRSGAAFAGARDAAGAAAVVCSAAAVSRADAALAQSALTLQAQHGASAGPHNSPRLQNLIRDGKIYISLHDAIALAIENNLDLAYFRYNFPIAQTDILRTKAGSPANGVNTAIVQSTQGGFSGFHRRRRRLVRIRVLPPALAASSPRPWAPEPPFRPSIPTSPSRATSITPSSRRPTSSWSACRFSRPTRSRSQSNFSAVVSHGHQVSASTISGSVSPATRLTTPSIPTLYSNFAVQITQPLLAGFGLATNERYIRIAKRNLQITDLAFKAQVIATVTQVENIYWDLVNAYEDEQIKERSLAFANKTLSDDQKQLELKAIPAMQVMTDQSAVATAEGDLTVARASLR